MPATRASITTILHKVLKKFVQYNFFILLFSLRFTLFVVVNHGKNCTNGEHCNKANSERSVVACGVSALVSSIAKAVILKAPKHIRTDKSTAIPRLKKLCFVVFISIKSFLNISPNRVKFDVS